MMILSRPKCVKEKRCIVCHAMCHVISVTCFSWYEDTALRVLNTCYDADKERARRLLVRPLVNWGQATVLSLAESAKAMVCAFFSVQ